MREIRFIQLNMHKAIAAATILNNKLAASPAICMLSEPRTYQNKVIQVPANHVCLPGVALPDRPRAALYIPRNLTHISLDHLSNRDCATALLDTKNGKILLASIYLDSNEDVVPNWLTTLIDYADSKRLPLLLAFDSNAHSELYGPDTNERGKDFEQFILNNNLMVENRGTAPTFLAVRRDNDISSTIDVTLSRGLIPLHDWKVHSGTFNGSDHFTITWSLLLELNDRPLIRPWKKAKWEIFTKHISDYEFHIPENLTTRKLDRLLDRWYTVVQGGLDKACPKRKANLTPVEIDWYGRDHRFLKNRAKRKYNAYRLSNCPKKRKAFVRAKLSYTRACKKGRKDSWQMFVEKTPNESNMATLFKITQQRDKRTINTLRKQNGTFAEPGSETIKILTDTHFPAAQEGSADMTHSNAHKIDMEVIREAHPWITEELVRKSLLQFKPNKAPGPDCLKPLVFRYLPPNAIEILTIIYKGCISLCHTPKAWRETKVIFLPKPGKSTYDIPKSYRPISLSNFLLKALERLVVWRMEDDMINHPIHHLQHGFTKGKSTESAISNTVDYIEQHLFEKVHCLGMFLDISSAFDSISIDHIRQTLLDHGGTPDMINWYHSYLGRRHLEVELHGETVHLTTATGFPQGGVCSAKFWLIAFDEAIRIINSGNVVGNGYADDCSALIGGDHPDNMIESMQGVLDRLVQWGHTCGLQFNAAKTVAVMFTRATRSFDRMVRMDGQLIPYSSSVVYLGVTLDRELKWNEHIHNKVQKAKRLLMKLSSITHSYWGPKPKLMKWAYTGIVRPMVSYAALSWGHATETEPIENALTKLNRQAINTIVKVPRSTPTKALEIILDIYPLPLHIKKEGLSTYMRLQEQLVLRWDGVYSNLTYSVSHLRFWNYLLQDSGISDLQSQSDDCRVKRPELKFTLNAESFVDMQSCQGLHDINVYTDGSKLRGKVGAGVHIFDRSGIRHEASYRLPDFATVYQAEVLAIKKAADTLASWQNLTTVKFFVDSQAALRSFQMYTIKSKLTLQMILSLNRIKHKSLTFVWTKAHIGTAGNEKADALAKQGSQLEDNHIILVPEPACDAKNALEQRIRTLWQKDWETYPDARQSKLYYPRINKKTAKITIQWPKLKLGRYIRAITGHCNLLYHLHVMHADIPPTCRFCLQKDEEFYHLANECPPLWWERQRITALEPLNDEWSPHQIAAFAFTPKINEAFIRPLYNLPSRSTQNEVIMEDSQDPDDISNPPSDLESEDDPAIMDVSSEADSSSQSDISILSSTSDIVAD